MDQLERCLEHAELSVVSASRAVGLVGWACELQRVAAVMRELPEVKALGPCALTNAIVPSNHLQVIAELACFGDGSAVKLP
jgi:hypothetical protein